MKHGDITGLGEGLNGRRSGHHERDSLVGHRGPGKGCLHD